MALEKNRLKVGCLLYDTGGVCVFICGIFWSCIANRLHATVHVQLSSSLDSGWLHLAFFCIALANRASANWYLWRKID